MTMQEVDRIENIILDTIGESEFLNAITKALSYDTKADIYKYIARQYDIREADEDETGED